MKKQNQIDDLFRRELADHTVTPSPERRATLLRDAEGIQRKGSASAWWIAGTTLLILAGFGIAFFIHQISDSSNPPSAIQQSSNQVPQPPSNPVPQLPSNPVTQPPSNPATQPPSNPVTQPPSNPVTQPPSNPVTQLPSNPATQPPSNPVTQLPSNPATQPPSNPVTQPPSNPVTQPPSNPVTQPPSNPVTQLPSHQQPDIRYPSKKWNISIGANYTPEVMFNTLNGDKFANNMGLEGTFHVGRYSVRTGVGLSFTTGWNEMLVESNPYLGAYKALDSITFAWGDNYNLVPTYFTKTEAVFDTTLQYTYTDIKKRYTYLQVPLVLGYDFWENSWLSLGVRAGAVMSVLLNTKTSSMTFDPGKDRIVQINNITPDRIELNWQAMGGINAAFRLSQRFSIELEPEIRYYFNSVYESSVLTKKPWSVGVRAAVVVTF